ncbi:MAG: response regulator transcription factor [Pontiellaceae bacterium]|nr:response regulator transcription factor [Pontiellaceae bacterium]MBN2786227.1 response regulator transcription factor [Pontiellaceae bacterium]
MSDKKTVVIVDDDRGTRELIAEQLADSEEFECLELFDGPEKAIKGILASEPDIVLMDINMPGMTGIECVEQLKPWLPNTDFIMLTVYNESEFIFKALAAGAVGYLLKRSVAEGLIEALRDAVAGGSPMDLSIARLVVQSFQKPRKKVDIEISELSERQYQVLQLLARGKPYKLIADELDLSIHTVQTYIRRIYEKLHVNSRAEAVAKLTGMDRD